MHVVYSLFPAISAQFTQHKTQKITNKPPILGFKVVQGRWF